MTTASHNVAMVAQSVSCIHKKDNDTAIKQFKVRANSVEISVIVQKLRPSKISLGRSDKTYSAYDG